MKTFKASFCERNRCAPTAFARKVLWRTLPLSVLPLALVWSVFFPATFAADLRLIEDCGDARDLKQVRDEIGAYFTDAYCWSFSRRRLHLRISTHKLKSLVRKYLEYRSSPERGPSGRFVAAI